jgi:hypothetical protein
VSPPPRAGEVREKAYTDDERDPPLRLFADPGESLRAAAPSIVVIMSLLAPMSWLADNDADDDDDDGVLEYDECSSVLDPPCE